MPKLTQLKAIRQRKALTQQELADLAGVNRVTIARIETGVDQPIPRTIRKLAAALDIDPAALDPSGIESPSAHSDRQVEQDTPLPGVEVPNADRPGVARLLAVEPHLVDLIAEATEQLPHFLPGAHLRLEHLVDPEYGDAQLFLRIIPADGDLRAAREALRRFDESWWFQNAHRAGASLLIDVRPS